MTTANILFVVPPYLSIGEMGKDNPESWVTSCAVPLGVLSIASYIDKYASVNMSILDLNVSIANRPKAFVDTEWDQFLKKEIDELNLDFVPDIVGISAIFNSQISYLHLISKYCKQIWPELLVTTGGGGPSNLSQEVFDMAPSIDAIAKGEAEKPFLHLIEATDRISFFESSNVWKTRKGLKEGKEYRVDFIEDLDEIPYLKYDLLESNHNLEDESGKTSQESDIFHNRNLSYVKEGARAASMMTSRGCPFYCSFCSTHTIHGRKMRYHSVERVVEDALRLKKEFGVNAILFEDDLFFANRKISVKIVEALGKEGFELDFSGGLSVAHINHDNVIEAMKNARVRVVKLAVESGCERVLKELIKKPYSKLSMAKDVVKRLRDADIYIRAFWVIGYPGETREEISESLRFFKESGCNWISIMIAAPIAGSELYDQSKEQGLLLHNDIDKFHFGKANISLDHSTPREFQQLRYRLNLDLNFVNNYDMRNGHPEQALMGLEDVISRAPNHAFANYYISDCYQLLGDQEKSEKYLAKYFDIIGSNSKWREYAKHFELPLSTNVCGVMG